MCLSITIYECFVAIFENTFTRIKWICLSRFILQQLQLLQICGKLLKISLDEDLEQLDTS